MQYLYIEQRINKNDIYLTLSILFYPIIKFNIKRVPPFYIFFIFLSCKINYKLYISGPTKTVVVQHVPINVTIYRFNNHSERLNCFHFIRSELRYSTNNVSKDGTSLPVVPYMPTVLHAGCSVKLKTQNNLIQYLFQSDIDECEERLDDCQRLSQFCINSHGNYFCQDHVSKRCAPGFKVNVNTGVCEGTISISYLQNTLSTS